MIHQKYAQAFHLYCHTNFSQKSICNQCNVSLSGFRRYIQLYQRDELFKKYKLDSFSSATSYIRKPVGQTQLSQKKYHKAIMACADIAYIQFNISEIARQYHLSPTGLGNQLHAHYPDLLDWRFREQVARGLKTHRQLSHMYDSLAYYKSAVSLFKRTDLPIKEVAQSFQISATGLRQHLLFYHRDLIDKRRKKRAARKGQQIKGRRNGNNTLHVPKASSVQKYADALKLYKTTNLTIKEICSQTHVSLGGFSNYLRVWHRPLMFKRKARLNDI